MLHFLCLIFRVILTCIGMYFGISPWVSEKQIKKAEVNAIEGVLTDLNYIKIQNVIDKQEQMFYS